jgi:DNA modification methylase
MLAYAAYLGIADVSQMKTRFFKRDSTKADHLTLLPHKEEEFWLWVASWALFIQRPSDLGYSDDGYDLPPIEVVYHEVETEVAVGGTVESNGQVRMFNDASLGVKEAAKEKRDTLAERIAEMKRILEAEPSEHFLLWHDLEAERAAIEKAVPSAVSVYGSQPLDERERTILDFSDGRIQYLAAKPVMLGAGCNLQYHCSNAIFAGIGFKFNDFIQAVHRIYRFLQSRKVKIHIIHADTERGVLENLLAKWRRYEERAKKMSAIIQEFGLSQQAMLQAMQRKMGVERVEVSGEGYRLINNDCTEELHTEAARIPDDSVGLILTSIPFSTQYEYSPNYADFGHSESNAQFFRQMDFLTPHLLRVLQPGRIAAIHVKDRIVPGGMTGLGFQTVYPFHLDCIQHYTRHGFAYMGMKTIVTDVVRENNQTYRLGWTEQCKDGSKMGAGMPEYLLLFRKPPTDRTNSYADLPVVKDKAKYSRARWQVDAHGFARSSGNRPPRPEELQSLRHEQIFKLFRDWSLNNIYDFEYHVKLGEALEERRRLPVTFMLLQPASWHPDVWSDITRMRTLNGAQSAKGKQMHLCPMQFDIAERVITQFSMESETVLDPFGGLMTVPMTAVKLRRRGIGIELNLNYFLDGCAYVEAAAREIAMPSLFDVIEAETDQAAVTEESPLFAAIA